LPFVAALRAKMDLQRKTFARLTGFSERAIADWERGKPISEAGLRRLREIERLQDRLAQVVRADFIPQWLETPNQAFEGLKPLEVIERGQIDRLWRMLFYLESGVAS
jgi:transcriptional regulator with XRE-family HTH domain